MPTGAASQASSGPDPLLESWRWVRFGVDSGLPVDGVQQVVEATDGTMWALTDAGIAWFDDYRWHPMGSARGAPVVANHLVADDAGGVYLAAGQRLYRGDRRGFHPVPLVLDGDTIPVTRVVNLAEDELAILGPTGLFAARGGSVERIRISGAAPDDDERASLARGTQDRVFATTFPAGAWRTYRLTEGRWVEVAALHVDEAVGDADNGFLFSVVDHPGAIGAYSWHPGAQPERVATDDLTAPKAIAQRRDGTAIVTYASGVVLVRRRGVWSELRGAPDPLRWARSFFLESSGDLWVPTAAGLFLHRSSSTLWAPFPESGALASEKVNEILRTRGGDTWIGTERGLYVVGATGVVDTLSAVLGDAAGGVTALGEDSNGDIWVGSGAWEAGALRWDGASWRRFTSEDGFSDLAVHRIMPDRLGRLWFLTLGPSTSPVGVDAGGGAYRWDGERFERWSVKDGLPHDRVYTFAHAPDGAYWFGTLGGLGRWKDGEWTHWDEEDGLSYGRVFSMTTGPDGDVWFTHRAGRLLVGRIGPDDMVHYVAPAGAALGLSDSWELETGPDWSVWATAATGLWRWKDGTWTQLGPASGLPGTGHWPLLPLEDRVLVGTLGAGVRTLDLTADRNPPPVVDITRGVDGRAVTLRWRALAYRGELPPHQVATRVRVTGVEWGPWTTRRDTTLVDLAPGTHIVELQARGLLGQLSAPEPILFAIPTPFVRRPAVIGAFLLWLALMAALATAYVYRARQGRRRLERQEARFRSLIDNAMDVVGVIDASGDIRFASASAGALLGVTVSELVGTPALQWTSPDVRRVGARMLRKVLRSEVPVGPITVTLAHPAGEKPIVEAVLRRIPGERGGSRILVNARDATERVRAQAERESLIGALESKNEELERFAYTVSHDLKSPLVTIKGFLGLLERDTRAGDTERVRADVEQIGAAADSMHRMLSDLLDLSRAGQVANPSKPVDLQELVEDVLSRLRGPLAGAGVAVEITGEFPTVVGDRVRLEEVFQNLVENAIKFMGGQPEPLIRIGVMAHPRGTIFFVQDNGVGIDEEYHQRIFGLFDQLDPRLPGSGIGLTLVKRIIGVHGGSIWVESDGRGHGATFCFTLGWSPV